MARINTIAALFLLTIGMSSAVFAASPATRPSRKTTDPKTLYWADLTSGDDARVSTAVAKIEEYAKKRLSRAGQAVGLLIQAKLYPQAESVATDVMLFNPTNTAAFAEMQKIRAAALRGEGKPVEALSAAKAYYDVALLRNTEDAINLVSTSLATAHPEDQTIATRFKIQQAAWAATQPSTESSSDLGESVLNNIKVDGSPFEKAVAGINPSGYWQYVAKGNLLLASGKGKEAEPLFEKALAIAPQDQAANAVENVARAIRAEAGCVAPANAYILSLRGQPQ
jgi:tetratricopeptide (TPR) repeat protein